MPARRSPDSGRGFFPMRPAEAAALVFLVLLSTVSFLPIWRSVEIAGMAVFGWLMAALMVISPAVTLWVFRRGERK